MVNTKDKGVDPGAEPPCIKLCWVPHPPPPGSSIRLLEREKQIGDQKQARLSLSIPFRFRSIWLTADKDYSPLKEPLSFCFDKIIILQVDRLPKNTAVNPLVTFLLDCSTWSTLPFLDTRTRLGAGCHHASPLARKAWRYPLNGELWQISASSITTSTKKGKNDSKINHLQEPSCHLLFKKLKQYMFLFPALRGLDLISKHACTSRG